MKRLYWLFLLLPLSALVLAQPNADLNLTAQELAWLQNHQQIRLASDNAWPPFEWVDKHGEYKGIASEYMRLIEDKLGIEFILEKEKPWPNVVAAFKSKELDVFSCVAKNPEREQYANFTYPYLSFPMVIITTDKHHYIHHVKDLKGLAVAVVEGYATHEYLSKNHPEILLTLVENSMQGLTAVSKGKIDAFVDNIATATFIIKTQGLTNLKISGEMPVRYELAMAVRSDWPELTPILQKALDSITDEQRRDIHNNWIGIRYEHHFDYRVLAKSFIAFFIVVSVLYIYIRKLSLEVKQRKIAVQEALEARDEANRANQAKSEFLAVMSHELRTPLTSIKGALGVLLKKSAKELSQKHLKILAIAYRNSERLSLLVDDILDIEKLLSGKTEFQQELIDINQLVEDAVAECQGYAASYQVRVCVFKNAPADCRIVAEQRRLVQVTANLLSNAIKFSDKDGDVAVTIDKHQGKVRVSVKDNGAGIPENFKQHIFSHFSQADASDTRQQSGTGLGLAISKEIVERQGGSIGFNSEEGKGSVFFFEFDEYNASTLLAQNS